MPVPAALEYRCIDVSAFDASRLESELNANAQHGWRVVGVTNLLVVLERKKPKGK